MKLLNQLGMSVVLANLLTSGVALADSYNEGSTSKVNFYDVKPEMKTSNNDPQGWVPFAAAGFSSVEFDQSLTNRDGTAGNLRLIGSYYNQARNFVFDTGLGVESSKLEGDAVTSGLLELAGRLRFGNTNKWQVGPVADMNFGNNVGTAYGSSEEEVATFAGAQLVRDFAIGEESILRGGLKAMTDIGIPNSTVNKFLFELQLGAVGSATTVSENHEMTQEAAVVEELEEFEEDATEVIETEPETAMETVVESIEAETFKVPASIYFATGAEKMGPRNKRVVKKLVEILRDNRDSVESINVTGFTDARGENSLNEELSAKRAETVANELMNAGISQLEIDSVVGKGELTTEEVDSDLRRARRVDLEIKGVSNSKLLEELKTLWKVK